MATMVAMNTDVAQRWREHRGIYRPAGEVIKTADYEVAEIPFAEAKAFVEMHHYSGSVPAALECYGFIRGSRLVGSLIFSWPMSDRVFDRLPCDREECRELGRVVLLDSVPGNGESRFISQAFAQQRRKGVRGIVSFSDPMPRTDAAGVTIFKGHIGGIYQATNATYVGRATPRTLRLLPDGSVFSERAASKIRKRERGWGYASAILVKYGARPLRDVDDAAKWLAHWRNKLTRPVRHQGNHTYLFGLDRLTKTHLPPSQQYPKFNLPNVEIQQ